MSKFKLAKDAVTSKFARQILIGQKHSPTILFAAGVVGVVGTVVVASQATLKLDEILSEADSIRKDGQLLLDESHPDYSEEKFDQDMKTLRVKTWIKIGKNYAPAVGLGIVSVACLFGSHHILTKRNVAITAAYATVSKTLEEYRGRVVKELGPEKDREFLYGTVDREIVTEGKNGPEVSTIKVAAGTAMYAKLFDSSNPNWNPQPEYNLVFLKAQQNWINDKLHARGHVFLNDVYDALGLPRTQEGSQVGWLSGPKGRDNYIDFGMLDDEGAFHAFIIGQDQSLLLDFNVDGVIWDKI